MTNQERLERSLNASQHTHAHSLPGTVLLTKTKERKVPTNKPVGLCLWILQCQVGQLGKNDKNCEKKLKRTNDSHTHNWSRAEVKSIRAKISVVVLVVTTTTSVVTRRAAKEKHESKRDYFGAPTNRPTLAWPVPNFSQAVDAKKEGKKVNSQMSGERSLKEKEGHKRMWKTFRQKTKKKEEQLYWNHFETLRERNLKE